MAKKRCVRRGNIRKAFVDKDLEGQIPKEIVPSKRKLEEDHELERRQTPLKKRRLNPVRDLKAKDITKGLKIGEGVAGEVFRCRVRGEDGQFKKGVLKILKNNGPMDKIIFLHEVERLNKLQGIEGVPHLYGKRITARETSLVTSYNGNTTLKTFLLRNMEDLPKICGVLAKVAQILENIHRTGVGHNDLHACNVMVEESEDLEEPKPTIIDFGHCLPFGSRLFRFPIKDPKNFHYDPHLSINCGQTSPETDIYSFARILKVIPGFQNCPRLKFLVNRALSSNLVLRPSLKDLSLALTSVQKGKADGRMTEFFFNVMDKAIEFVDKFRGELIG